MNTGLRIEEFFKTDKGKEFIRNTNDILENLEWIPIQKGKNQWPTKPTKLSRSRWGE